MEREPENKIVREVKLRIKSTSREGEPALRCPAESPMTLDEEDRIADRMIGPPPDAEEEDDPGESFELTLDGGITDDGEKFTLLYLESILNGMPGVATMVEFYWNDPGLITVSRHGTLRSTFVLEAGRTHQGVYKLPEGSMDVATYTRSLENDLDAEGGSIKMDYRIRLGGIATMDVQMEISIIGIYEFDDEEEE